MSTAPYHTPVYPVSENTMSEEDRGGNTGEGGEVKSEESQSTINIKVSGSGLPPEFFCEMGTPLMLHLGVFSRS